MMAAATDTMELIIGVLLASVTGYALVGYHRQWSPGQEAAMKYFQGWGRRCTGAVYFVAARKHSLAVGHSSHGYGHHDLG